MQTFRGVPTASPSCGNSAVQDTALALVSFMHAASRRPRRGTEVLRHPRREAWQGMSWGSIQDFAGNFPKLWLTCSTPCSGRCRWPEEPKRRQCTAKPPKTCCAIMPLRNSGTLAAPLASRSIRNCVCTRNEGFSVYMRPPRCCAVCRLCLHVFCNVQHREPWDCHWHRAACGTAVDPALLCMPAELQTALQGCSDRKSSVGWLTSSESKNPAPQHSSQVASSLGARCLLHASASCVLLAGINACTQLLCKFTAPHPETGVLGRVSSGTSHTRASAGC